MSAKRSFTVGIDLGGTKVAAGLVDSEGRIHKQVTLPTVPPDMVDSDIRIASAPSAKDVKKHIDYVVSAMADAAMLCCEDISLNQILGVGLASAGPMDVAKGILVQPSNFKGWGQVPIVEKLRLALKKRGLQKRISFQNDAIAAALGEGWKGVAKGKSTYVVVTVGTGIGTGVILNGIPAQSRGMGSEWGHMIAHAPGFARHPESFLEREVEALSSGTGLIREAKKRGLRFTHSGEVAEAARSGDREALALFERAQEGLAALFYSLSLGFHPEVIAVTGGMLAIEDMFLPQAIALYQSAMASKSSAFTAPVRISKLGSRAGLVGAARLPRL